MRRTDDGSKTFARQEDRLVRRHGCWFLVTREGERGPFYGRIAADRELRRYVDTMAYLDRHRAELPADINPADVTLVEMDQVLRDQQ